MIAFDQVCKRYSNGHEALKSMTLDIANGEFAERSDRVAMIEPIIARSTDPG
jgi:hypothetical protein